MVVTKSVYSDHKHGVTALWRPGFPTGVENLVGGGWGGALQNLTSGGLELINGGHGGLKTAFLKSR